MAKNAAFTKAESESGISKFRNSGKKMIVLFSMILVGAILVAYKSNYEAWADQFIQYNQILFGICAFLMVLLILIVILNIRTIFKHELLGSIFLAIGGLIIVVADSRSYLGFGGGGGDITGIIAVGAVIIVLGCIFLMRTGGYVGACFGGIIVNMVVAGFYLFDQSSAIQYNNNTSMYINLSIIYFIISFLLLGYNDLKFFYLAKLMRDENNLRRKKKYNEALGYCDKAIKIYPYFVPAWNNKGNVYVNLGKKQDAIKCYKKALSLNPQYIPAKKNLKLMNVRV
jgi:tetratricopeptide (TPR) repeat protein